jgi:hypothetical protein
MHVLSHNVVNKEKNILRNKLRFPSYFSFAGEMDKKNFAVFGASSAGRRVVEHLAPLQPKFYLDNNQQLVGESICGLLVLAPTRGLLVSLDSLIITSLNYFSIAHDSNLGFNMEVEFIVPPVELIYGYY